MLRRTWWFAVACALASGAAHSEEIGFTEWLQEVSSVAPLRMRGGAPTAILPGFFRNARRADAVVIYEDNASLCRGPEYSRCLPLGYLSARRTVATNIAGVSQLLVLDSMQSVRVCEVDVSDHRASLDCKTVDFNKLADYNITSMADGRLLQIDGTDGKYFCSAAADVGTSCSHVINSDGTLTVKTTEQRQDERQHGMIFKPDGQKECRVKSGKIDCSGLLKSSLNEEPVWWLAQALIKLEEVEVRGWRDRAFTEVNHHARYVDSSAPIRDTYWRGEGYPSLTNQPERPPTYYRDQCLAFCAQQNTDYADLCALSAGLALVIFGPGGTAIAPLYWVACDAGRAYNNIRCRQICGV